MKWSLFLLLGAICTTPRMSHYRSGMGSCRAIDPNIIECGGKQMATVQCYAPGDEACGALAVQYADGERVFLLRPPGWQPESQTSIDNNLVLRPEMSGDASMIWFKSSDRNASWQIYETNTGIMREVDNFRIFQIRERERHSVPLWAAHAQPAQQPPETPPSQPPPGQ
jgi:hypothetical protein